MPNADFFPKLGLYVQKNFFDADLCRSIRAEMSTAQFDKAFTVRYGTGEVVLDENFRNCRHANITKSTRAMVEKRILEIRPNVEKHFSATLSRFEKPSFLLYRDGDFFAPHIDVRKSPSLSSTANVTTLFTDRRKVSLVLFLNRQAENSTPDAFSGGSLTFYGLLDNPDLKDIGFPLEAEEGLLVAFSSDVMHEVKSVTNGQRYTVVSWFS